MQLKLGILAGGGPLPRYLTDHCHRIGREFFLLGFKKNADAKLLNGIPVKWVRLGAAGKIIKLLKKEKVKEVVMVGPVRRPSLINLFPDLGGVRFLIRVGSRAMGGDNSLLTAVANEIEREGFKVVGIDDLLSGLLAPEGCLGQHEPSFKDLEYIKNGIEKALIFGQEDKGQAVVILNERIIGTENQKGTDDLIRRCTNNSSIGENPILIKIKKPGQDRRIDLPTIGARTVELAAECGYSGIAVETGQTLIIEPEKVKKLADEYGLFVLGTKVGDGK